MIGTRLFIIMLTINLLIVVGNGMGACDYSFTSNLVSWSQSTLGWSVSGTGANATVNLQNTTSSTSVEAGDSPYSNPLSWVWKGIGVMLDMFLAPLTIFMATGMPWQIQLLIGVPWSALWFLSMFAFIRGAYF